jgi:hypothetical protein
LLKGCWTTSSFCKKSWQNSKGKLIFRPWLNTARITKMLTNLSWNHVVFHAFMKSTSTNPMPYVMND